MHGVLNMRQLTNLRFFHQASRLSAGRASYRIPQSLRAAEPQITASSRASQTNVNIPRIDPALLRILPTPTIMPIIRNLYLEPILLPFLPIATLVAALYFFSPERETPVLHAPIDLNSQSRKNFMVSSDNYIRVGDKPKGDLSGEIVEDKFDKTKRYLKKGAPHLKGLLQEFLISEFLEMIRPGIQPESLIMQELQEDGQARFYTLSRMYPNTMDLEDFVKQGDWKEKLAKKPLIGFEVALAADNIFAKQQDMKLANYIVTEKEDGFYVASIDHECAGANLFSFLNQRLFSIDITGLILGVRDLHPKNEDNHAGLAGDPRAREFMLEASKFMDENNIIEFYKKIAAADTKNITALISSIDGTGGLITALETHPYFMEIADIQAGAVKFLYNYASEKSIEEENIAPNPMR